jgi:hypothetical protein
MLLVILLLGLPFDLEDGSDMFLRDTDRLLPNYTTLQLRRL